ncbi:transcription factor SPT20 homolog isoform X1 [Oncorhynchus mykiss]|uniref:Platelet-derived growth factor beta polypeptide a n=1 Tax=Oncorhynchus mykiss TaxID=8022 RepID=A0A8K9UC68_ONCMY|nr:transcription factor SPT20 homolog isoform X1 [Oncorhynchus mykiss]
MNSWVLLLAALAAGCLRFGSAEGDPLPPSLVELVRTSPISSIEDLQQLLEQETDSQEVEPDESSANEIHSNDTRGRYRRNLVDAQPAQQAVCKVRTEVMEVTRAMLDRRNANFLLWPPCVEVQRCSGCCNTRMLQCVPTVTQTRYLQVTRIQYIDKRPHYDKAVISVEDHASCRCQTHPSATAAARSTSLPPPPPRLTPKPPSLSKEDLHRHDNMKANQRFHVDDRGQLERQWQNKYTLSHTQPRTHTQTHPMAGAGTQVGTHTHTQPRTHTQTHPMAGSGTQVGTHTDTHTQMGPSHELPIGHGSGYEGGRGEERGSQTPHRTHTDTQPNTGERQHIDNTERTQEIGRQQQLQQYYQQQQYLQQQRQYQQQQQQQQQQHQQHQQQQYQPYSQEPELRTQYKHNAPQSDSSGPPDTKQPANHKPELVHSNTEPTDDNDSSTEVANRDALKDTEVTSQGQAVTEVTNHGKEDDKERHSQTELSNQEQKHSESTNQGDSVTEEESRKKLLELLQRELGQKQQHHPPHPHLPHQDHHHPHHRQSRTQTTTTQRPVPPTLSSSRAPGWSPSTPSPPPKPPQGPFRPALPRGRRRRKHRSRISKAALRTMIM